MLLILATSTKCFSWSRRKPLKRTDANLIILKSICPKIDLLFVLLLLLLLFKVACLSLYKHVPSVGHYLTRVGKFFIVDSVNVKIVAKYYH